MSLLEDIFLEDETEEARALERIIEGDEYEDLQRSDEDRNSAEEAEEDKRHIDPSKEKTKRVIKNPRFVLNPARLTGPRGIKVIPEHFKDFKFKGKGHEKEDLDIVLKRLEHWAYRLYPKFKFEDCLKKIETLGKKTPVVVHLHKIRSDQILSDEPVVQKDSSDEESNMPEEDEFDKLLQQQIDIARSTPKTKKPEIDKGNTSSPLPLSQATTSLALSNEQRERMMRNRQLALERRLARMKQNNNDFNQSQIKSTENNDSRNENENNNDSAKILNTILDTNSHTIDHYIPNQGEDVTSCNKILSQDNDYQIIQTHSICDKDNKDNVKESNGLNNNCNSNIEVISACIPSTDNETDKNRNGSNAANALSSNNNVFHMQIVSVEVHQTESTSSDIQKSGAGDMFSKNLERLTNDDPTNLIDNKNKLNNCNDIDSNTVATKRNQTFLDDSHVKYSDIEMTDNGLLGSLDKNVTEVTVNKQMVETVTVNMSTE